MFRHQGKSRTFTHNRQIATVLSFVAGIVNVSGFLALGKLTTNVTGHFALLVQNVDRLEWEMAFACFLYVFFFFLGSFVSSFLIEFFRENKKLNVFVFPIIIESCVLLLVAFLSIYFPLEKLHIAVYLLLFAMGLQNSCVTKISNAVIRTTHLTGLFTDLGIELSHFLFKKFSQNYEQLKKTIKLRLYIISFFFFGGSVGFYIHTTLGHGLKVLMLAVLVLIGGLLYDDFKFSVLKRKRKYQQRREVNGVI